jgi:tetratricopeptide (TPR) repeat protein
MFAGRNQEAEATLRKAAASTESDRRRSLALVNLGYVLLEEKNYVESAKALDQAIEARPDGAVAYSTRAEVYLRQGIQPEKALELLDRGIQLKTNSVMQSDSDVHMFGYFQANRAWALFLLGRRAEAEQALEQADQWQHKAMAYEHFKPGCAGVRYRMGMALLAGGEKDRARDEFRQVSTIDPHSKYAALSQAALRNC